MDERKPYTGKERRIHKVYVTRNSEYHVRAGLCVAVKPRKGSWITDHEAVAMKLVAHMKVGTLLPLLDTPKLGNRLYFSVGKDDVLTSPVVAIIRPPKAVVAEYPSDKDLPKRRVSTKPAKDKIQ